MYFKILSSAMLLLALSLSLPGKDKPKPFYPAASIDSAMKKEAWAVCREFSQEFILHDNAKAVERIHFVMTVLDKRGDDFAELELPYDKTSKISSISGKNYDAAGMADEKLKSRAIQDVNYTSEGAIYDDLRMKTAKLETANTYPYTVEYNYEITYDGLLGYPTWQPLNGYHLSVEKSQYSISYPEAMGIRYRELNLPAGCRTEKTEKGIRTLEWKIASLPAMKEESVSPKLQEVTARVVTAPVTFDYCGTAGTLNTWVDFGKWISQLIENRDQLPPVRQNEISERIKGMKDTTQIVRTLYEMMQKRTHYVGIQLGIGGYQPFPAETVDRLGYGDCKALSNYMKAILKAAGIKSQYTVAGAASSQGITMTDFPTANQLNHVILCVPLQKDTIWLECTSQTDPCGYLDRSTAGRKVLIIDPKGSRIVTTPLLTAEQSCQSRKAEVILSADGAISAKVQTKYAGYQYDNISEVLTENRKEQEKALYENLSVPGLVVSGFDYKDTRSKIPVATENISLSSPTFTTRSGSRIFVPVNVFNQIKSVPARVENRKMPVYREFAFLDTDSVTFSLPAGFKPETIPHGKTLTSTFGEYCSTLTVQGDQLRYTRRFKMNRGTWPKEQYAALLDFYAAIVIADKVKLVLREEAK